MWELKPLAVGELLPPKGGDSVEGLWSGRICIFLSHCMTMRRPKWRRLMIKRSLYRRIPESGRMNIGGTMGGTWRQLMGSLSRRNWSWLRLSLIRWSQVLIDRGLVYGAGGTAVALFSILGHILTGHLLRGALADVLFFFLAAVAALAGGSAGPSRPFIFSWHERKV